MREGEREGASLCVEWSDNGGDTVPPSALSLPVRACFLTWAGVELGARHLVNRLTAKWVLWAPFPQAGS